MQLMPSSSPAAHALPVCGLLDAQESEEELAGGVAGRLGCIALSAHSLAASEEECGKENWLKGIQGSAALRNAHHILSMQRP